MSSLFSSGGGSPPVAPKLQQVGTKLTDPLYMRSAHIGDKWARLMRASYGLESPSKGAPASWEAKYLGPGALAMMGQAGLPFAGKQDPQQQELLNRAFGAPSFQGAGGAFGGGGAGSTWNLGSNPYQTAQQLGQQFTAPLGQQQRSQQFLTSMLNQWKPPDLRLTGEDLLNVAMGQAAQSGKAQQAAFESQLLGANYAAQQQGLANAATLGALGQLGGAGIKAGFSSSLSPEGYYQPSLFGGLFGGAGGASDAFSGITYGAGSDVSTAFGPELESATSGMGT